MKAQHLTVVTLNWNGWPDTIDCVASIRRLQPTPDIIVIDNGSTDDSVERLTSAGIDPVVCKENLGFAGGCNLGIRLALDRGAEWIFLLNNDAIVDHSQEDLKPLLDLGARHPHSLLGVVTFDPSSKKPLFQGHRWPHILFGLSGQPYIELEANLRKTGYVEGSAVLLSRVLACKLMDRYGRVFDEDYFLYCEDVDLGRRVELVGGMNLIWEGTKIYHKVSQSGGGQGNRLAFYYITRNRILLARRWLAPVFLWIFYVYYTVTRVVLLGLRMSHLERSCRWAQWSGLKDGLLGITGKWRQHDS